MSLPQKIKNLRKQYIEQCKRVAREEEMLSVLGSKLEAQCSHAVVVEFVAEITLGGRILEPSKRACWMCGLREQHVVFDEDPTAHLCDSPDCGFAYLRAAPIAKLAGSLVPFHGIMAIPKKNLLAKLQKINGEYLEWRQKVEGDVKV